MARMLGRVHDPNCDCNIEHIISGASEKCNHRYGNKRQRSREKWEWTRELNQEEEYEEGDEC